MDEKRTIDSKTIMLNDGGCCGDDNADDDDESAETSDSDRPSSVSVNDDGERPANTALIEKPRPISPLPATQPLLPSTRQIKLNYTCICVFAFLLGTDFAVIIPTLWDRLSVDFEASGAFMGLVLSSYSLTGVISGLVMGKIPSKIS